MMNRSREHMSDPAIGQLSDGSLRALSPIAISGPGLLLALRLIRP